MLAHSFRKTPIIKALLLCGLLLCVFLLHAQKDSSAKIRHVLILPIIGRSIETGWSFGLAGSSTFRLKSLVPDTTIRASDVQALSPGDPVPVTVPPVLKARTSNVQALALYTTRGQFIVALNGSIYFPGERFILNQQFSYSSFPDKFWGLGKTAPDSTKEAYKFKQYYVYLHPQRHLGNNLFLGLIYEFQRVLDVVYEGGGLFDKQNISGRKGYHVSGLGLSFTYDTRNNAFSPDRGMMLQFWFNQFDQILGSDYQYTNFVLDLRRFIPIHRRQVLALQAYGFFNKGDVPLRSLAYLGGASSMRGYYEGRYRDKNQVTLQGEYRVHLFARFGAVAFGDIGNVGSHLKELNFQYLKYSYGGGLRIALSKSEKLNLRLDYGISGESSSGFYLQLGEAF